MRMIGSISDAEQSERFSNYLLTQGLRNHVEESSSAPAVANGNEWVVWVEDDDRIEEGKAMLAEFLRDPNDMRYQRVGKEAEQLRRDQANRADRLRRQHVDVRTRWSDPGRFATPVTMGLLAASLVVGLMTLLGERFDAAQRLTITPFKMVETEFGQIPAFERSLDAPLRRGQVWRFVTPIFVHFGALHLLFNSIWLLDLGSAIERRRGMLFMLALVLASAVLGNLAQFFASGPYFGGMSGVVYALFGYVWIKGKCEPQLGLGLRSDIVLIMLIWLGLGFTGVLGPIGNAAHLVGLIVGAAIAWTPYKWRRLRRGR